MPLDTATKQEIIKKYGEKTGPGTVDVQIALLQARIKQITEHLKKNKKDYHSRIGLLKMVGQRRRLEAYLRDQDIERYRALIKELGIRELKPR
ncbi:MAG: 30S ribosomal protein S15 [Fimbriimonadaceae bacterium]|jgi:small subunit ribosomal protein S15